MKTETRPKIIAKKIGVPVHKWEGRCHEIAGKMLAAKLAPGKLRYGHWLGPIDTASKVFGGRVFTHHGWIENGEQIIDPTRWGFEAVEPYIYVGPNDFYDTGGNQLAEALRQPCPTYKDGRRKERLALQLTVEATQHLVTLSGYEPPWTHFQLLWIGSAPLHHLGNHAEEIYRALINNGNGAAIPFDNRQMVIGD